VTTSVGTHLGVASTIDQLQSELPALEAQQGTLEKDLAAVTGRLEAVRAALTSLHALSSVPVVQEGAPVAEPQAAVETAPEDTTEQPAAPAPEAATKRRGAGRKAAAGRKSAVDKAAVPAPRTAKKAAVVKATKKAAPAKRTQGLTESIVDTLAKSGSSMKAGEINKSLGRDDTNANVNAVRTALERLVKASRAQRVGRGLYQTAAS
jgi:hypothetical protein